MSSTIPSKKWMTANHVSMEYIDSVESFIKFAKENVEDLDWCCCPCVKCRNLKKHNLVIIMKHLVCDGINKSYTIWKQHGESFSNGIDKSYTIMRRLDEESRARKDLEEKINALSSHGSSHGTHMFDLGDQLGSSSQERRQSSVHLESPVDQLPSHCVLKNFKNKNVAVVRVDRNASQSDLLSTIIVDGIYDISAELYACDGTLGDITPGAIITWPNSFVHFI